MKEPNNGVKTVIKDILFDVRFKPDLERSKGFNPVPLNKLETV